MTDYPAGAFVTGTGIKNAALQFKTCIYKASEVPTATRREISNLPSPLTALNGKMFTSTTLTKQGSRPIWRIFRAGKSQPRA